MYADKTARLQQLVSTGTRTFLPRPRCFGQSLIVSPLDAMFSGRMDLFHGLAAESWVRTSGRKARAGHPSGPGRYGHRKHRKFLPQPERRHDLASRGRRGLPFSTRFVDGRFQELMRKLCQQAGPVVALIDEYGKPILEHIGGLEQNEIFRRCLLSFYTVLKDYGRYLRFALLTGYAQEEQEDSFSGWKDATAAQMGIARAAFLEKIKGYYDGFCVDSVHRFYNSFSVLNFSGRQGSFQLLVQLRLAHLYCGLYAEPCHSKPG